MKKIARKKDSSSLALAHLGGLTAKQFLREYWQKKPLLIRNAFPHFVDPLSKREVFELSQRDDAESRFIAKTSNGWQLQHGPFNKREFAKLKNELWTVLIQDTQHFSNEAHEVLTKFNFIPHARVDDLMVSYAVPGAGVGAHFDSYDVFLLQGVGKRRWQISAQKDQRLLDGVPLKILARFRPEQEHVLESGDMLYLPPGYAHHGVAETECLTWSIGFRAPSQQELSTALLDHLRDEIKLDGQYRDADLAPARHPGEIDAAMQQRIGKMLMDVQDASRNKEVVRRFLGSYLTEPKSHVYFDSPEPIMSAAAFRRMSGRNGIKLDLKTRLLYLDGMFFMNGNVFASNADDGADLRQLADTRGLPAALLAGRGSPVLHAALYGAFVDGFLHPA